VLGEQSESDDVHPGYCDESGNDGRSMTNDVDEEKSSWTTVVKWKDRKPKKE
jgi:hypothetical protein